MGFFVVASMGSNRTFMELKYFTNIQVNPHLYRSNRTFMELKCEMVRGFLTLVTF